MHNFTNEKLERHIVNNLSKGQNYVPSIGQVGERSALPENVELDIKTLANRLNKTYANTGCNTLIKLGLHNSYIPIIDKKNTLLIP